MNMFEICNLQKKNFRLLYTRQQKEFIDLMPDLEGHEWTGGLDYGIWNRGDLDKISELKKYIKEALIESQGLFCAYCGMPLRLTSNEQIEHIAPKGKDRYPQFMFHSSNLTLACSLCNGFEKKEKPEHFNTIGKLNNKYENCYFNIVHPYLDNPEDHYVLGQNDNIGITISSISLKGQKSITVFTLDDEIHTNERGKKYRDFLLDYDPRFKDAYIAASEKFNKK